MHRLRSSHPHHPHHPLRLRLPRQRAAAPRTCSATWNATRQKASALSRTTRSPPSLKKRRFVNFGFRRQECLWFGYARAARWPSRRDALLRRGASVVLRPICADGGLFPLHPPKPTPHRCYGKPYLEIGPIENRALPTLETGARAWKSSVAIEPGSVALHHANNGNDGNLDTEVHVPTQRNPWWQVELTEPTVSTAIFCIRWPYSNFCFEVIETTNRQAQVQRGRISAVQLSRCPAGP